MKTIVQPKFNSLLDVVKHFPDEKSCREHLEKMRWTDKIVCPQCGSDRKIYRINDGKLFKCADCLKQFTVRVGTIFEDSALPLQKWFMGIYLIMAHKKGISSIQLGKDIEVTQKTAWFMLHRIRYAIRTKSFDKQLNGIVEADETYVGGKTTRSRKNNNKTIVAGIIERGGRITAKTVEHASIKELMGHIHDNVSKEATIYTDEHVSYQGLKYVYKQHETITHGEKEYVRGNVHTNTIESFWALLKRGIVGIYHHVGKKHLNKYVDEFEFRYNNRHIHDVERFSSMLSCCNGRLMYRDLIN